MKQKENQLGKIRPYDLELEAAVLGAIMLEKDSMLEVEHITSNSFDLEAHKHIFEAIEQLYREDEAIDIITVTNKLRTLKKLDNKLTPVFVTKLTQRVNSAANIKHHCYILKQLELKRELIKISSIALNDAYENDTDPFDIADFLNTKVEYIQELSSVDEGRSIADIAFDAVNDINKRVDAKRNNKAVGIPSGCPVIDKELGGFEGGQLIYLAGRPGMGKTMYALYLLECFANTIDKENDEVIFYSLEMSEMSLVKRLLAAISGVDSFAIKTGNLWNDEQEAIAKASLILSELPIHIDDTPALSVHALRRKAKIRNNKKNVKFIVVDYIGLMDLTAIKNFSKEQMLAETSRKLKLLAKELDIPVVVLSQLSRKCEERSDKRPILSDLRDSGSLEQDADMVAFVYRDDYYKDEEETKDNCIEVDFQKIRDGDPKILPYKVEMNTGRIF